jgi:hypothetical protein
MEELLSLISRYCKKRNLDEAAYLEGMNNRGFADANPALIATLISYHKEWLR